MKSTWTRSELILTLIVIVFIGLPQVDSWEWPSLNFFGGIPRISNEPQCYTDFGCFKRFPPTKALKLPDFVGLYPSPPEDINVTFYLYSCNSPFRPYVMTWNETDERVKKSPYIPKLRTIFIVHGFRDLFEEMGWMGDLKDFILDDQSKMNKASLCKHNVIAVDWRNGSQIKWYPQAVSNTQMVGATIAHLIKQLIRIYDDTEDDFTVVGHSLGSHISGFAGKQFEKNKKIRNIIGLDPAGPCFTDIDNDHRLSPNDAQLVLTIHTNGGLHVGDNFGTMIPLGHYSFFPNGGSQQPGCEKTTAITKILLDGFMVGLTDTVACSHRRATRLVQFNESLLTYAESVAYACNSYEDYETGQCGECNNEDDCRPFGSWFTYWQEQKPSPNWKEPISYYIDTASMIPWAMFTFQVNIQTGANFEPFNGSLVARPIGELRDGLPTQITPSNGHIEPDSTYSYLIKNPKDLGKVTRILLSLTKREAGMVESLFHSANEDDSATVIVEQVTVKFLSNLKTEERSSKSSRLISASKEVSLNVETLFEVK